MLKSEEARLEEDKVIGLRLSPDIENKTIITKLNHFKCEEDFLKNYAHMQILMSTSLHIISMYIS